MLFLYNSGLLFFKLGIELAALFGNKKAKLWLEGRRNGKALITNFKKKPGKTYWIHCSSLGEFEQGRPLIEALKKESTDNNIVLTFFSPSGYEVRKNYPSADLVSYLPLDGSSRSHEFIDSLKPDVVFFVKYDYWHYYFKALNQRKIPLYIVSGIFRESQHFFKWYGIFFRKILRNVTYFFLQDAKSAELLNSINIKSHSITGDTRFDRVTKSVTDRINIPVLGKFKDNSDLLVAGSTWYKDEQLLFKSFLRLQDHKFKLLIAPHDISELRISQLEKAARNFSNSFKVALFSEAHDKDPSTFNILILDTMGQLSSAYALGNIAYVGGGFGSGIHNTLEPAAYGIPVIFGPNHKKFREAKELIEIGAAFCVHSNDELSLILDTLLKQKSLHVGAGKAALEYIHKNTGATQKILNELARLNSSENILS